MARLALQLDHMDIGIDFQNANDQVECCGAVDM